MGKLHNEQHNYRLLSSTIYSVGKISDKQHGINSAEKV